MSRMLTFHPHKPELAVPGMAPSLPSEEVSMQTEGGGGGGKFNSFIQPAVAYENGSVFMSGPLTQWPI